MAAARATSQRQDAGARGARTATAHDGARSEILKRHFALMREFAEAESAVSLEFQRHMSALPAPSGWPPPPAHAGPIGRILEKGAKRLYAERVFNLKNDEYLKDHVVGGRAGENRVARPGLPVIPFAYSLELAAQGALACLGGGYVVSSVSDVRAHRWLALDHDTLKVGIRAELDGDTPLAPRVRVELSQDTGGFKSRAFEALVCLGRRRPEAEKRGVTVDWNGQGLDGATAYDNLLFHGPSLQPLRRIQFRPGGRVEALCETPRRAGLDEALPVALLDGVAQLMFLCLRDQGHKNFSVFPYSLKRLLPAAAAPPPGTRLLCRGRVHCDGAKVTGDFEFVNQRGAVVYSLEGFTERYFSLPAVYAERVLGGDGSTFISDEWRFPGVPLVARVFGDFPPTFLDQSWGAWRRILLQQILGPLEFAAAQQLSEQGGEQSAWLIRQCVAKEALCAWFAERHQLSLSRSEVQIVGELSGRHTILCPKLEAAGRLPQVAVASAGDAVLAVVAPPEARVGVALRSVRDADVDFALGFEGDEKSACGARPAEHLLSLLCAKESAAKVMGLRLPEGLKRCRIEESDLGRGLVAVSHDGGALSVRVGSRGGVVAGVYAIIDGI
jgi:hypothetical protein